jgi:hypothetical protein
MKGRIWWIRYHCIRSRSGDVRFRSTSNEQGNQGAWAWHAQRVASLHWRAWHRGIDTYLPPSSSIGTIPKSAVTHAEDCLHYPVRTRVARNCLDGCRVVPIVVGALQCCPAVCPLNGPVPCIFLFAGLRLRPRMLLHATTRWDRRARPPRREKNSVRAARTARRVRAPSWPLVIGQYAYRTCSCSLLGWAPARSSRPARPKGSRLDRRLAWAPWAVVLPLGSRGLANWWLS